MKRARPFAGSLALVLIALVLGKAAGRRGAESFSFGELKSAWRSGAIRHDGQWRRRGVTMIGALLLTVGICGLFIVVGPPWIKLLVGGALIYALSRIAWGLWRA